MCAYPHTRKRRALTGAATDDVAALARQYGPTVFRAAWRILGISRRRRRRAAAAVPAAHRIAAARGGIRGRRISPPRRRGWPSTHLRRQRRWRLLAPLWKAEEPDDSPAEDAERAEAAPFPALRARADSIHAMPSCFVMRHLHGLVARRHRPRRSASRKTTSVSVCIARVSRSKQCRRGAVPMNTLDQTLESVRREPDGRCGGRGRAAQARSADRRARRARRVAVRAASAAGWRRRLRRRSVALAVLLLPLTPTPALAFSAVQKHLRDFRTLRFDIEQRMNGARTCRDARRHDARRQCAHRRRRRTSTVVVNSAEQTRAHADACRRASPW